MSLIATVLKHLCSNITLQKALHKTEGLFFLAYPLTALKEHFIQFQIIGNGVDFIFFSPSYSLPLYYSV